MVDLHHQMMKLIMRSFIRSDLATVRILQTIHRAAKSGARSLLAESVLIKPQNKPDFAKLLDLEMLVVPSRGCERTEQEFAQLLQTAVV